MKGSTVLITGATGGIGLELAGLFARDGYELILSARSEDALQRLAGELYRSYGVQVHVLPADLADPQAPERLLRETGALGLQVDVLVNNAGYGLYAPFAKGDLKSQLDMIQVNVNALTHLTGLFLPGMIARRRGRVLNVGSTAAFLPGPFMAVYYATKAFVLSFTEALSNELRGTGVTATALCPGPTRTGFEERAKLSGSRLFKLRVMDPGTVALAGYEGMKRGKALVIPGFSNRLMAWASPRLPRKLMLPIVRWIQDKA